MRTWVCGVGGGAASRGASTLQPPSWVAPPRHRLTAPPVCLPCNQAKHYELLRQMYRRVYCGAACSPSLLPEARAGTDVRL